MEVYTLTSRGRALSHSRKGDNTPAWKIVYFLAKQKQATNEQIINYVPGADATVLARLKFKKIITNESGGEGI